MSFARKFGLRAAAALFSLSIFGLAVAFSVNSALGTPDNLKQALQEGKVYEVIADELARNFSAEALTEQNIQVDQKTVQDAAKAAITPELVQENSEKIIDGTYSWLDGTTQTPDFKLDTEKIQEQMSLNLTTAAAERVQKLPPCTPAQLQQFDPGTLDPFSLPCQPPGFNAATIRKQLDRNLESRDGLLQSEPVTSSDITTSEGQNVFAQADRVPGIFQLGQKLPWIFGVLAILAAGLVIFFNEPRLRGVKSLSVSLLITGVLLLVSMTIVSFIFKQIGTNIGGTGNEAGSAALTVAQTLTSQVNNPLKIFAVAYLLIGVVGLVLPRFIKPRPQPITPPQPPNDTPDIPPAQQSTL